MIVELMLFLMVIVLLIALGAEAKRSHHFRDELIEWHQSQIDSLETLIDNDQEVETDLGRLGAHKEAIAFLKQTLK